MAYKYLPLRLFPILIAGLIFNGYFLKYADEDFIFKFEFLLFLGFIFTAVFIWIFFTDKNVFKKTGSRLSFLPTLTGVISFTFFILVAVILSNRDNSPIIIKAGYDGGFNGAWFEFREDGTYKFANSGGIGASYTRGTYILKDSLIILDKENIDGVIQTNRLVIRKEKILYTLEQVIYQINKEHRIIEKDLKFIINFDNRNNKMD